MSSTEPHHTSSPIINSQAAELINSYIVIWTEISQLVLHNSGVPLNHSLWQNIKVQTCIVCCCWPALHCEQWVTALQSCFITLQTSTCSMQTTSAAADQGCSAFNIKGTQRLFWNTLQQKPSKLTSALAVSRHHTAPVNMCFPLGSQIQWEAECN